MADMKHAQPAAKPILSAKTSKALAASLVAINPDAGELIRLLGKKPRRTNRTGRPE